MRAFMVYYIGGPCDLSKEAHEREPDRIIVKMCTPMSLTDVPDRRTVPDAAVARTVKYETVPIGAPLENNDKLFLAIYKP